jgi:ribose 5-phosphate isomerase B
MSKRITIGADSAGFELKGSVIAHLKKQGYEVIDMGTDSSESCDYPVFARKVSEDVLSNPGTLGILICGTGIGMSMAANKHNGIRAALCSDTYSARLTRNHNDANLLCMGARVIGPALALDIVDSFLGAEFEGGRHKRRIDMFVDIENAQK